MCMLSSVCTRYAFSIGDRIQLRLRHDATNMSIQIKNNEIRLCAPSLSLLFACLILFLSCYAHLAVLNGHEDDDSKLSRHYCLRVRVLSGVTRPFASYFTITLSFAHSFCVRICVSGVSNARFDAVVHVALSLFLCVRSPGRLNVEK